MNNLLYPTSLRHATKGACICETRLLRLRSVMYVYAKDSYLDTIHMSK